MSFYTYAPFCELVFVIGRRGIITIKILIVDDEEIILEEVSETLTDEGYECFVASNVRAAVDVVEAAPELSLIITDLRMPYESGAGLIKIVEKKFRQDIKFIVMSGHAVPGFETDVIDLSLHHFLKKPLDVNNLLDMVGTVLATKK